jgi:hypothetical protein
MPSRPRPLAQIRRRLLPDASRYLRRAARRARAAASPAAMPDTLALGGPLAGPIAGPIAGADETAGRDGPFASRRAKLPVATLLPHHSEGRPRVMTGAVQRWFEHRWSWVQPRMIPLIAALVGLIAVLNARRYLLELARGPAVVCPAPDATQVASPAPGLAAHDDPACPPTAHHAAR